MLRNKSSRVISKIPSVKLTQGFNMQSRIYIYIYIYIHFLNSANEYVDFTVRFTIALPIACRKTPGYNVKLYQNRIHTIFYKVCNLLNMIQFKDVL